MKVSGSDLLNKTNGRIDLITYSFPCQDLSVAGSFHGFNQGMAKGSGTRSGLLWEIERIVLELKELDKLPKFLLLENVKNMISARHREHYDIWMKQLHELGYSSKTFILKASAYGIPQDRERVYGLSILNYKGKADDKGNILDMPNPKQISKTKTLKNILRENYGDEIRKLEALEAQPNRTPSRERMFNGNRVLNDYRKHTASRTVTTKQDRHPNAGVIDLSNTIIGGENRILDKDNFIKANYRFLTTREAYLMMGFTDKDYDRVKQCGLRREKLYQQAGNSIVVDVMISIMNIIQKEWQNG